MGVSDFGCELLASWVLWFLAISCVSNVQMSNVSPF